MTPRIDERTFASDEPIRATDPERGEIVDAARSVTLTTGSRVTTMKPVPPGPEPRTPMRVAPSPATPGGTLEVTYRRNTFRGVAYDLQAPTNGRWGTYYYLISEPRHGLASRPGTQPSDYWWAVDDAEGRGVNDLGVGGRGPDTLPVPDTATAGTYRLCTANAIDRVCGLVEIS